MGKLVVFKIGEGNFERGFPVTLQIGEDNQPHFTETTGRLPPETKIPEIYSRWQSAYYGLGGMRIDVPLAQITNVSSSENCQRFATELRHCLNEWLKKPELRNLERRLLRTVSESERVRFILQTQDPLLRRLPWHLWDLFEEYYPNAEIALSAKYEPHCQRLKFPVKILAILGSSEGINIEEDRKLLKQLPGAKVTLLEKPQRQKLNELLWNQRWDILFFAGHSSSNEGGQSGEIQLNDNESLDLDDLKYALEKAVRKGLSLAIFNSCDGLGLAQSLADKKIPQMIVMREPVPDEVAQEFLKKFLQSLAQRKSFYLSVREARQQLQGIEGNFPCATWLPIICQNPAAVPPIWPNLRWLKIAGAIAPALVLACLWWWWTQQPLNRISLGDKILVKAIANEHKQVGVIAFGLHNFKFAVKEFRAALKQERNDPETLIYLNNAQIANEPNLKIAVSVPIGSNLDVAQEILRGVAQAQDEVNRQGGINQQRLQVAIASDDNDPNITHQLATNFVKNPQIMAVVGHNASDASVAAAPVYENGKLVMVSPTSFSQELSQKGYKYIFRTVPSIRFEADALSHYAIKAAHKSNIAICGDDKAVDNQSFISELQSSIPNEGGNIIDISCNLSADEFNPNLAISDAISHGADSLVLGPHVDRINKALEIAAANKGRLTLFASPTLDTSQTLKFGQADVNGMVVAIPWHPAAFPRNPFAQNAIKLWGGSVNWRTAMAYDATVAIVKGLQQTTTREQLQQKLHEQSFSANGATGLIQFLPTGDRVAWASPKRNGKAILVKIQPSRTSHTGYDFYFLTK